MGTALDFTTARAFQFAAQGEIYQDAALDLCREIRSGRLSSAEALYKSSVALRWGIVGLDLMVDARALLDGQPPVPRSSHE